MKKLILLSLFSLSLSAANPLHTVIRKMKENPQKTKKMMLASEAGSIGIMLLKHYLAAPPRRSVTIFGPGTPTVGAPK